MIVNSKAMKIEAEAATQGNMGQKFLVRGEQVSMRLWENEQPGEPKPPTERSYETVGYVISGRAELHLDGQVLQLEPGSSWTVPQGASHHYQILEPFTAVEATCPPAEMQSHDQ